MNLIVDVGNTYTKLAVFENSTILVKYSVIRKDVLKTTRIIRKSHADIQCAIVSSVGSLNKSALKYIETHYETLVLNAKTKLPYTNLYSTPNTLGIDRIALVSASVEEFSPSLPDSGVTVESVDRATDKVSIADAEIVVSAGRGLKGPENWGMIEELAEVLGAATACSKPVSDLGWRPHSEHVGQTGKPVASNLYIAIGISGAIQHLAGINSSKVKVVINTDPEAPFFKAADYGVVGDAFDVVPKLIEKLKAFKAQNA